jgi:uncharacterized protein (DUF58 family)
VPTPAGWCAVAISAIALGIPRPALQTMDPRPFVGVVLLLALLGELGALLADRKPVAAGVEVPAVLRCEQIGTVRVWITEPLPNQRVRYLSTHELDETGATAFDVEPRQRGIFRLRDLYLEDTGPIGLLRRSRIIVSPHEQMVCVGPIRKHLAADFNQNNSFNATVPSADRTLDRLRAYVSGDDVRLLNWRSTARVGQPMIEVHLPQAIDPVIVIDLGPNPGEKAEAWASLAAAALEQLLLQAPLLVRSRDAQGEMTRPVTGEPVSLGGALLYIGAWRNDLEEAQSKGVHVISDHTISGHSISGDTTSNHTTSNHTTSNHTISDHTISDRSVQ